MASGVIFEAHERSLRVPDDLSVAGFDDTLLAPHIWPGLTTIHQPIAELGEHATQKLFAQIKGQPVEPVTEIATSFVERRSTGRVPGQSDSAQVASAAEPVSP
jgi:LacI family transcriptional regulator